MFEEFLFQVWGLCPRCWASLRRCLSLWLSIIIKSVCPIPESIMSHFSVILNSYLELSYRWIKFKSKKSTCFEFILINLIWSKFSWLLCILIVCPFLFFICLIICCCKLCLLWRAVKTKGSSFYSWECVGLSASPLVCCVELIQLEVEWGLGFVVLITSVCYKP